jgi:transcriptional regulator with XRE-family HTH domain
MTIIPVPGVTGHDERDWPAPPDPGDLSRRLATRRAELRLSVGQVAGRARVPARYLEYLESFPAQPGPAILRRLAAALRTTPGALLGAGLGAPTGSRALAGSGALTGPWALTGVEVSGGRPPADPSGQLERLSPLECRHLLALGGIGRIAFGTASGLMVLPANFAVVADTVVLRTGSGSLIAAHADDEVSFETDHFDEVLGQGWSVLVRGRAHRVLQLGELRNLQAACDLVPWPADEHDLYVRIVSDHITGRRVRVQ